MVVAFLEMEVCMEKEAHYSSYERLKNVFIQNGQSCRFKADSKEEYIKWRDEVHPKLWNLLGLDRMKACSLEPELLEITLIEDGITREKWSIQVESGCYMPFYVLIPPRERWKMTRNQKPECRIALHGHLSGGKEAVVGNKESSEIVKAIEKYNYDYGLKSAILGYICVCPDARGFGERREKADLQADSSVLNSSCQFLARMAEPLGLTVAGLCTWDFMRLIDYIFERDEWDTQALGCIGFSGGGMLTLWLSALDERIQYAIISGYMYGYKDSLLALHENCSCNYIPGLWEVVDMGDIACLIAPRPLLIQSCEKDHLNGERGMINVFEQTRTIEKAYEILNSKEVFVHDIQPGGHSWHHHILNNSMTKP